MTGTSQPPRKRRYLPATADQEEPTKEGTAQPVPKRLRRDARARAPEDAVAERRARTPRSVVPHGDGLFLSNANCRYLAATAGTDEHDEPPEAEATTRCRLVRDAGYLVSVTRRRPDDSIEGVFQVRDIQWTWRPRHREQHPVTGVLVPRAEERELHRADASSRMMPALACSSGLGSPILTSSEGAGDGMLGAAADILLVQPRQNGIPPSTLQTIRAAGLSYWVEALRFWIATRLGRSFNLPGSWSWASIMGQPAYGPGGICVLCALATCVRAQHCLQFERRYGAGSFPYQLSDAHGVPYLKDACKAAGVWGAKMADGELPAPEGGARMGDVVELMMNRDIWVRTEDVPGWKSCVLPIWRYTEIPVIADDDPAPQYIAWLIRIHGPIMGALHAGPNYRLSDYHENYVYPGEPGKVDHAVVCMEYFNTADGDLYLRVMDSTTSRGPLRWIVFGAFTYFFRVEVDPLDRAQLQLQRNNPSLLRRLLSFFRRR